MPSENKPIVFISYAREDAAIADAAYKELESAGFRPWMDRRDLVPGEQWQQAIVKALKKSDFVLLCASPRSIRKRGMVQREVKIALDLWREKMEDDIFLIPLRIEGTEMPDNLTNFQWVDYSSPAWGEQVVKAVQEGLRRSGKPPHSERQSAVQYSPLLSSAVVVDAVASIYDNMQNKLNIMLAACKTSNQRSLVLQAFIVARHGYDDCLGVEFHDDESTRNLVSHAHKAGDNIKGIETRLNDMPEVLGILNNASSITTQLAAQSLAHR